MRKKRPRYPVGHSVAGQSPIARPLYSDDRCELYSLGVTGSNETLLLITDSKGAESDCQRLEKWWAVQPAQILKVAESLRHADGPAGFCFAKLEMGGLNVVNQNFAEAEEGQLRRLLDSLLDLVDDCLRIEMFPDLAPSLMWVARDGTAICAVMPMPSPVPSETEQVRLVARAFYSIASGIDIEQMKGSLPPLSRWSKFASSELSMVMGRCLEPLGSKSQMASLSSLSSILKSGRDAQPDVSKKKGRPAVDSRRDGEETGLGKVAGMHDLKELLFREVVDPIRNPEPHKRYGLSIPNGILLYGPPGCGKTYIARQLAEELGHYFVEIIPSELASPYVHGSVTHIRNLFDSAAEQAPAIIFIDEFEALVPNRGDLGGFQQYKAEEVNEFLANLNGCAEKGIFVIAATNEPTKIDPAVRRTGRLDKMIYVGPPDAEARQEMLALHLRKRPLAADVDLAELASMLVGYSASDIRFLVDEAARKALKDGGEITTASFRFAAGRIPPSVTAETEARHQSIEQRGVS